MNKKKTFIAGVMVALALGAAWAFGFFGGVDSEVAELQKERDEAFERMDELSDEERRAQFRDFRERVGQLTEEQRQQFFESSRPLFQQMALNRMNRFFELTPEEQTKELDDLIDRIEERRSNREAGEGEGRGGRGGNWSDMSPAERDQRRKERLDRTTPEMRAKFDRFRDMLNERLEQRGLEPIEGMRGMFGGGRR